MTDKKSPSSIADLMVDPKRRKPNFIAQPNMDHVVDVVLRLAMEICVLRDRLDIHEKLAEEHGVGGTEAVENFQADEALTQLQAERRDKLIRRIIDDLQ